MQALELLRREEPVAQLAGISLLRDLTGSEEIRRRLSELATSEHEEVATAARKALGLTSRTEVVSSANPLRIDVASSSEVALSRAGLRLLLVNPMVPNSGVPTPQADSLEVLIRAIAERQVSGTRFADSIAARGLATRQVNYYENALKFLLLEEFEFAHPGHILHSAELHLDDFVSFSSIVLGRHGVVRRLLREYVLPVSSRATSQPESIMTAWLTELEMPSLSPVTLKRRTQTAVAWTGWVFNQLEAIAAGSPRRAASIDGNDLNLVAKRLEVESDARSQKIIRNAKDNQARMDSSFQHVNPNGDHALIQRVGAISKTDAPILSEIAQEWGVTRERVRQVESRLVESAKRALRAYGAKLFDAMRSAEQQEKPINIERWILDSLAKTRANHGNPTDAECHADGFSRETDGPMSSRVLAMEPEFREGNESLFVPRESVELQVYVTSFLLKTALGMDDYGPDKDFHYLWVKPGFLSVERTRELKAAQAELVVPVKEQRRKQRIESIKKVLWDEKLRVKELAERLGEASPKALAEFLRRQPEFITHRGFWFLTENADELPAFPDVYTAVVSGLKTHGPMSVEGLRQYVAKNYPVGDSRLLQALDDRRIGRIPDGRIALVEQGGEREVESEPTIPTELVLNGRDANLVMRVTREMMRGSGFQIPRWIGWRLSLNATPESATLVSDKDENLTIKRRGGQIYSSSIRRLLRVRDIDEGCAIGIQFQFENRSFAIEHLCLECGARNPD